MPAAASNTSITRRAVEKGELRKYYRVRQMARDLPALRAKMHRDFRRKGLTKEKVCAGIVLLIGEGFFRVGSDKYQKENNTFGITTMRKSHVTHTRRTPSLLSIGQAIDSRSGTW